jgi:hypothetical protein
MSLKMYLFLILNVSHVVYKYDCHDFFVTKSVYNSFPRLREPSRELCYVINGKAENKPTINDGT